MKTTSYGKYKTFQLLRPYSEARRFCTLNGGHLAVFETLAEYNAFGTLPRHYWVGADDLKTEGEKICKIHSQCMEGWIPSSEFELTANSLSAHFVMMIHKHNCLSVIDYKCKQLRC